MSSPSEDDLSCVICQDIFQNPVILPCSHSFCTDCVEEWWREKAVHQCPVCKKVAYLNDLPSNLAIKNLSEAFLRDRGDREQKAPEALCSLHSEKLKLFCLDHHQPVCVVCRDSKTHENHKFRPIKEAALDHRAELQRSLKPLQDTLKLFKKVKSRLDETADHIKNQAQHTEKLIRDQFRKFHEFLQEEEEARITALKEEEEQKSRAMKEKIGALSREISALSGIVRASEKELRAEDISFLENYKAAVERAQQRPLPDDPQLVSGALIDVSKYLGNLAFNIWNQMKEIVHYSPVILDPNTAYRELVLSEDLTSVKFGDIQQRPDNPERIEMHPYVLASESFDSGTHIWACEIINDKFWALGVVQESVQRRQHIPRGYWQLCLINGKYTAASPPLPNKVLSVSQLQRIRVHLDFDEGDLSFYDLDTNTHIHTFKHTFTGKMLPYIGNCNKLPLTILPVPVSASVEHHSLSTKSRTA